jgi:hypothetical protein
MTQMGQKNDVIGYKNWPNWPNEESADMLPLRDIQRKRKEKGEFVYIWEREK